MGFKTKILKMKSTENLDLPKDAKAKYKLNFVNEN